MSQDGPIPVKVPDDILHGVYANQMVVRHSPEEFVLDFVSLFPPEGIVNARVIVSPGHLKRMIGALEENLARYESRFGTVREADPPKPGPMQN